MKELVLNLLKKTWMQSQMGRETGEIKETNESIVEKFDFNKLNQPIHKFDEETCIHSSELIIRFKNLQMIEAVININHELATKYVTAE